RTGERRIAHTAYPRVYVLHTVLVYSDRVYIVARQDVVSAYRLLKTYREFLYVRIVHPRVVDPAKAAVFEIGVVCIRRRGRQRIHDKSEIWEVPDSHACIHQIQHRLINRGVGLLSREESQVLKDLIVEDAVPAPDHQIALAHRVVGKPDSRLELFPT